MSWTLQQLHIWGWAEGMPKEMCIQTHLVADVINSSPGVCQSVRAKDCEIQFYRAWQEPRRGNCSWQTPLAPHTVLWEPRRGPGYGLSGFSFFYIWGAFPLFPFTGASMGDSRIAYPSSCSVSWRAQTQWFAVVTLKRHFTCIRFFCPCLRGSSTAGEQGQMEDR